MKKILVFLILASCQWDIGWVHLGIVDCMAQKQTSVARQFDGSMPYYHLLDRVVIEGGQELNAYKLSLYKSVTVKENAFTPKELAQQAFKDMEHDVEEAAKNEGTPLLRFPNDEARLLHLLSKRFVAKRLQTGSNHRIYGGTEELQHEHE